MMSSCLFDVKPLPLSQWGQETTSRCSLTERTTGPLRVRLLRKTYYKLGFFCCERRAKNVHQLPPPQYSWINCHSSDQQWPTNKLHEIIQIKIQTHLSPFFQFSCPLRCFQSINQSIHFHLKFQIQISDTDTKLSAGSFAATAGDQI